jgi:hypothetical protein
MTAPNLEEEVWRVFCQDFVPSVDPERLSVCFGRAIGPGLCAELRASPRLKDRLETALSRTYSLPPVPAHFPGEEEDAAIAMLPAGAFMEAMPRAGAIYWAAAIANTVLAPHVAALRAAIGDELCGLAVRNRDLAGPSRSFPSLENVSGEIAESGKRCFSAWCDALDPGIGVRVRLKLAPDEIIDASPPPEYAGLGPMIFRRAASPTQR